MSSPSAAASPAAVGTAGRQPEDFIRVGKALKVEALKVSSSRGDSSGTSDGVV